MPNQNSFIDIMYHALMKLKDIDKQSQKRFNERNERTRKNYRILASNLNLSFVQNTIADLI
jgi:hypothetical protein